MILFEGDTFTDEACPVPSPHRHEFHELFWTRSGEGRHLLDGERATVTANTLMLTGRGQIHRFEMARNLFGAVIRFGGELLHGPGSLPDFGHLFVGHGILTVDVPPPDTERLDAVVRALAAETRQAVEAHSTDVHRYLLMTLLAWAERWSVQDPFLRHEAPADIRLARRFADVLERDFTRHHDVGHYARELDVSSGTLWRALSRARGRPPRTLITERVMLEAARLLRFTDMPVGAISEKVGVQDQLYFSRAFKNRYGEAPLAYRTRLHGGDGGGA
ncbi:HTH-type transcriptional activator RhaS [Streptomyces sp. ADI96-02]|uniref:helix-turn-helix transcriptional regulator n=1 Tax=Streptomyces sp. ADI96-02 TaxID=1522760 RepID=UPI000F554616|nr:AraC family transcriptional regulator [Streptomyces sp. ADI96-02]RPK57789.1 HTH-type transcriptional activator RhaS [Streptomyces sp. ADI96-02]